MSKWAPSEIYSDHGPWFTSEGFGTKPTFQTVYCPSVSQIPGPTRELSTRTQLWLEEVSTPQGHGTAATGTHLLGLRAISVVGTYTEPSLPRLFDDTSPRPGATSPGRLCSAQVSWGTPNPVTGVPLSRERHDHRHVSSGGPPTPVRGQDGPEQP